MIQSGRLLKPVARERKMRHVRESIFFKSAMAVLAAWMFLYTPCTTSASDHSLKPLPRWLKGYEIQSEFIPTNKDEIGTIKHLQGRVIIIHQEMDQAFYGKTGDPVFEKDVIATLADSVCRIQFSSRDSASLSPNSILEIEAYLDARSANKKSSTLKLKAGRAFFYVLRLLGYRDIDCKVETPSSVAAVRGTKFGLHVYESQDPKTGETTVFTNCYCADGLIEIDGRMVEPGELYRSVTGEVRPAPPAYLNQFHAALNLPSPVLETVSEDVPAPTAARQSRSALIERNEAHTENTQDVHHLNLVRQKTGPGAKPSPGPNEPPTEPNEPPTEPNEPLGDDDFDDDYDWDDDDHPGQGHGHQNHGDDHPGQGQGHEKFD
jgi:hypothetical protein